MAADPDACILKHRCVHSEDTDGEKDLCYSYDRLKVDECRSIFLQLTYPLS